MHVQSRTTNILPSSRRASSPAPPPCCLPSSPGPGRLFSLKLGWTRPGSSHFKEHAKGRHGVRASAAQATLEPAVRSLHTLPLRGSASLPEIPTDGRAGRETPARTSLPTPDANYERAIPRPGLPDTALLFPERRSNRGHSLAHLRFMGRGDISMCPSQAQPGRWESGSLLGPDLGHLPRRSVLSRVWMSLTGGPSWSSASSTPVGAISRAARVPRGHKTNLSLVNYLTNLPSVDRAQRWEKTVCVK